MKLCSDDGFIKTDRHDGPFERHKRSFFFDAQYSSPAGPDFRFIRLNELIVPGIHHVKRISQRAECEFLFPCFSFMNGHYAKCRALASGYFAISIMATKNLKRVTDQEDKFFLKRIF